MRQFSTVYNHILYHWRNNQIKINKPLLVNIYVRNVKFHMCAAYMLLYMSILFSGSQSQNGSFLRFQGVGIQKSILCSLPWFANTSQKSPILWNPWDTVMMGKKISYKYCTLLETLCSLAEAWKIVFASTSHYSHHRSFASEYKVSHGNAKVQKHWITMWLKHLCGKKTNSVLDILIHWIWLLE